MDACVLGLGVWLVGNSFAMGIDASLIFSVVWVIANNWSGFPIHKENKQPTDSRCVRSKIVLLDFVAHFSLFRSDNPISRGVPPSQPSFPLRGHLRIVIRLLGSNGVAYYCSSYNSSVR